LSTGINDIYYSIEAAVSSEFKEKSSKFLAFAYPVNVETEIKENLQKLKEEFWDASHHCYAFMLGPKYDFFRANDAGEPSHSAGDPILSQIRSLNLTDVLVVVVRYFGGTKLGVSGLISAYKTAAREALSQAKIIEKYMTSIYNLKFGPENTSWVMKNIKNSNAEIVNQHFHYETVETILTVKVRKSVEETFINNLQSTLGIEVSGNL